MHPIVTRCVYGVAKNNQLNTATRVTQELQKSMSESLLILKPKHRKRELRTGYSAALDVRQGFMTTLRSLETTL